MFELSGKVRCRWAVAGRIDRPVLGEDSCDRLAVVEGDDVLMQCGLS